jgi:DNA polymerase III epsilon subunit-like protein
VWEKFSVGREEAAERLKDWLLTCENPMLCGHNIGFDSKFLEKLSHQTNIRFPVSHRTVDTHSLLMQLHLKGEIPIEATSSDGAFEWFDVKPPVLTRHTAPGDAMATARLMQKLHKRVVIDMLDEDEDQ